MATVLSMRNQIKTDLAIASADTLYDAQIDVAIRSALRQLRIRSFWFLETLDDLTLPISSNSLTLPTNFAAPETFDIISGGIRIFDGAGFSFISLSELRSTYWTTDPIQSGTPVACAISNRTLFFSHISDQAYTIVSPF